MSIISYRREKTMFATLVFASLLITFGVIVGLSMQQRAIAAATISQSSSISQQTSQPPPFCEESGQGSNFINRI